MRTTRTIGMVLAVLALTATAAFALIKNSSPTKYEKANNNVAIASEGGSVAITSSKGGSAILVADGMVPGETRGDTVKIENTGTLPVTLSMAASGITGTPAAASSIFHTKLFETGNESAPFYSGTVKDFSSSKVGDISPGESRSYTLQAILPADAGNEAENIKTTFNVDWTAVEKTSGPPPPECKLRKLRARFFVFKSKPVIRMVNKYQANASGKVKTTFYWRVKKGKKFVRGKKIGSMISKFKKTKGNTWGFNRIAQTQSLKAMKQFRKAPYGFAASMQPYKTAAYCKNYLNVDLSVLKRQYGNGQFTWFMNGSKFGFQK